jgi:hypothetical protein
LVANVLAALERGQVRMHAKAYLDIAGWMTLTLERLDEMQLCDIRRSGLIALRGLAENCLSDWCDDDWAADRMGLAAALSTWHELHERLASPK